MLSRKNIEFLVDEGTWPCISIYMPVQRAAPEPRPDITRLKDHIKETRVKLEKQGVDQRDVESLLEPMDNLIEDVSFWEHRKDGLALFRCPGLFHYYRLSRSFEDLTVVSNQFHFKPLLPLMTADSPFYILALSQKEVRLLHATRESVTELDLGDVPKRLADAIRYDQRTSEYQYHFHTTSAPTRGGWSAVFHGWGFGDEDKKADILRFFQKVDNGVSRLLKGEQAPLVLACVDYLASIYHEANHYPHLLNEAVTGNPEGQKPEHLRDLAWQIIEPRFRAQQEQDRTNYEEGKGAGLSHNQLDEVVPAAYYGRVGLLFVQRDRQEWGYFNPDMGGIAVDGEPGPQMADLLDLAAVHTILRDGRVYVVEHSDMPEDTELAALFRY